ncbi:Oidioi.mRNA.OKI2018_I69.PAR.g9070.t1.cds [Oikopleura dioica]|uniref:Oidioi.mRNA.OKI2018_I69.PAR.g9070.t1.cds n=1 Tax=Oikopleura dioica TaxID=34765 RepID=A0ABN7RIY1_OIKDI|nr:Oidioi.mRNA.OKI2018_I69.PAR.g9070.t1.cds [Oikopleura dioica]
MKTSKRIVKQSAELNITAVGCFVRQSIVSRSANENMKLVLQIAHAEKIAQIERLTEDGWYDNWDNDHLEGGEAHSFISLPSGKMLMLGGYVRDTWPGPERYQDKIWEFDLDEKWSFMEDQQ